MLHTIREHAQGWVAWAIVILISIPFALWGIQSYLGVGSEPVAASVNGIDITERELDSRFQQARLRLRDQLGAAYRPEMFDDKTMRAQVLDQLIRDNLLVQVSHEMGLRASDRELRAAILANPSFQAGGRFDNATYERMLELQGMRPAQYEENLRQRIVGSQLGRAVVASEVVTDRELADNIRLQRQTRRVSFARVPQSGFLTDEPVSEDDISAYYEANQSRFQIPERIKVEYLTLDAAAIDTNEIPTEQALRETYEAEIARFKQPERRRVRHILLTVPGDADADAEDAAKVRIGEIRDRIAAGEDFAALAKELSQDPGSAGRGGDLGLIEAGMMDTAFDGAAFALAEGELSEAVRSQFGYHLIQVTAIEPGSVKPFAEVRDRLASEATKRGAEGRFYDWAERLANLVYESSDSLQPAAQALGLEIKTSGWIGRSGGEGLLANKKVIAAAFSDDVLTEGRNSELIEPEGNALQAVVLRVTEHEEASFKPLDQVREEIVATLREQRAAEAAEEAAVGLVARLQDGARLAEVAARYPIVESGLIARDAAQVPAGVRELAFTMARPASGGASYGSTALENGDAAVVALFEVVDGSPDTLDAAARTQEKKGLAQTLGRNYYEDLVVDLEGRSRIERKPAAEGALAQ